MEIQPKQISEQTVPMIKTEKTLEKVTLPAVGTVLVKGPTFDGSSLWETYIRQFEGAACANNWTEKEGCFPRSLIKRTRGRTTTESAT